MLTKRAAGAGRASARGTMLLALPDSCSFYGQSSRWRSVAMAAEECDSRMCLSEHVSAALANHKKKKAPAYASRRPPQALHKPFNIPIVSGPIFVNLDASSTEGSDVLIAEV